MEGEGQARPQDPIWEEKKAEVLTDLALDTGGLLRQESGPCHC